MAKDLKMDMHGMEINNNEMQREFKQMMMRKNSSFLHSDDESDSQGSKEDNLERGQQEQEEFKDDFSSDPSLDMVRQAPSSDGEYQQ